VVLGTYNNVARTLQTAGPVVRTDQSFSVSAWVHLDAIPPAGVETFLSQDGTWRSGFFLGLRPNSTGAMCWTMLMHDADDPLSGTSQNLQVPLTAAQVGQDAGDNPVYVHLVVAYDAIAQRFSLYLNGVLKGVAQRTTRWQANGALAIGRALWTAAGQTDVHATDQATGVVDEVRVFQGVLNPDMVSRLYRTIDGVL
jgi:hypothetical protein